MLSYERYEDNIAVTDKYNIKDVKISKEVTYNGDINLVNKTKHKDDNHIPPLAAAVVGLNNTSMPLNSDLHFSNLWTDIDAQEAHLKTKPTCYLIIGKPGLGSYTLGESISKKLNCIHLSPRIVLLEEIEQKSSTGKCLDFNMRHNKVCKFDHILPIMQAKVESPVVKHRGYVISGLPIVTSSKSEPYLLNRLCAEESLTIVEDLLYDLIWNLKRKKKKQKVQKTSPHSSVSSDVDNAGEEEVEEEQVEEEQETEEPEELPVEMPKYLLDICTDIIFYQNISFTTKTANLFQQCLDLFNFKPDVIIHIISPDLDTLTKKSRKYFNCINNMSTFNPFISFTDLEVRWPSKYTMIDYSKPYDSHVFNPKYSCKQPINFKCNSVNQICNYKNNINPLVEQKLKDFDSKYILKIDGRTSVHQMLHYILGKLLFIPIKPVLIPKPLYLEEPPEDPEEFWSTVKQLNTIRSGVLNFNRYPSLWNTRCPVELQKRRAVEGKPKLAVSLFKHVYLLSSLDAMISFCKNPRPYLKLEYLEPTCRMIILGTKSSGKTMIAECLSWLFDTPIICYKTFLTNEKRKKYDSFSKSILSEIIATIEDARFMKWQSAEIERTSYLNKWFTTTLPELVKYVALFRRHSKFVSEEEVTEEENSLSEIELKKINKLKNQLSFLPILNDLELCKNAILDTNLLMYAPIELTTETARPTLPILGDKDVTEAISAYILANDLQKDIEPTTEELMNEMTQILQTIDKESMDTTQRYGKFIIDGFPSDPEFWGYLVDYKLLPDYSIVLIENKEIDIDLLRSYFIIDKSLKKYQERYVLSSDPLVTTKKQYKMPLEDIYLDIQILLHELLNNVFDGDLSEQNNVNDFTEVLTSFSEAIDKFREEWDSVKLKLEENSKAVIVVEIENKTDIEILDEVLLKLRQCYYLSCIPLENAELEEKDEEYNIIQDMLTYNDPYYLGETNIYCPIAYYDHSVMWEGKPEFCTQFDNKSYYFSTEQCLEVFQKDVTKYQSFSKPFKSLPPVRICVIGSIGSGKTTLSKLIAKELGLIHVDFAEFVNCSLIPKHFKKFGRQYENSFKDTPIDDEAIVEFQADEENDKFASDILGNENEIRRLLYNYFDKGAPLLSTFVQKLITLLWSTEPFSKSGFVLDGFPKLPSDVEDMISCFCIPDLVIDLQGSPEKTLERLSSKMFKKWKSLLYEAKNEARVKFEKERRKWFDSITKEVVIKLITDEILNNIFSDMSMTEINPEINTSVQSTIIDAHPSGSANVDANLFNLYHEMIQINPEPIDQTQWEKAEDVLERINTRLESIFEIDDENIQTLKDILGEQKIKNISINGNKSAAKVARSLLPKLSFLRNRQESFFEQTFIITCDIAETLLMEGFYLISKFNRMCPVYIFENSQTISNPYNACKRINKIFPVIHRSFIYFLSSVSNVQKFRKNPLKYIQSDAINSYWEYPLRLSIIGPGKCGKSELASKLAKRYGLMIISRGQAIRHVLENMQWSELATKMKAKLQLGECIDSELIMNAVHTVTIDYRVATNGFVFDGFPDNPAEASELQRIGLYPLIVINITSSKITVVKNSQNEIYFLLLKHKPPYSRSFIEYRHDKWQENFYAINQWINGDIQNLYTVCGDSSKWQCLQDTIHYIEEIIIKVNYYLCNVKAKIVPAHVMCFSNEIFEQRMSCFKNMCPICLRKNVLRHSGFPVDKKGLVQSGNILYWFCPDHMKLGLSRPNVYLKGKINVPEVPVAVTIVSPTLLYENGICIVTYAKNLPSQKIVKGDKKFAASYGGKYYLFCSQKCQQIFLAKPHTYYDVTVFKRPSFPKLSLKSLPNLGYLEQTLGNILTKACCSVTVARPKYPGLDIRVSGLLHVALFLKINNPLITKPVLPMYEKASIVYDARCKLIHDIRSRLRSIENPFAKYPTRCSPRRIDSGTVRKLSSVVSTSETSRVPVPDERFDYLCQFHKPASKVPAFLNVVDIAGLVRGAAEGQGLGNAFLSHIKACDAIFNLCRAFDDEDVIHVDGDVNPVRDLETIGEELRLKDEEQLVQSIEKLDRSVNRGGEKKLKPEYDTLMKIKTVLVDEKKHIRFGDWSAADIEVLNKYLFLTSKPALYLVNLSEKDYIRRKNKWLPKLKEWIDKNDPGAPLIPFSGVYESKLLDMEPPEREAFIKENVPSALDKIIVQGYKALQLEYFFTAGPDEVKAWTIQKGTKAPQAAGRIHTDFEKGFIMAEVMHFKDFREEGTEAACKAAGKYRQQGRNYVVEDGDIIFFKFNAGAGLKDAKKK